MRINYTLLEVNKKLVKRYYMENELIQQAIEWLKQEHKYDAKIFHAGKTHSVLEVTL